MAYFKSEQALDNGANEEYSYNWNKNKINNSDWATRSYVFTANESMVTDTAKYYNDGTQIKNVLTDRKIDITNTSEWHTYGLYWSETELKFFFDDEMV